MWLIFAVLSLFSYASSDLLGKKKMDTGNAAAPLEMLLGAEIFAFFVGTAMFVFGFCESGLAPWRILWEHPLVLVNLLCFVLYWLLYLLSLRYIGLSLEAAVSGANGILYFFGLILVNAVSGKLASVNDILHPARLIPVLFVLVFTCLLPNVELIANRTLTVSTRENAKTERHRTVIGLLILFLALMFDTADSLLTTLIFDSHKIGIKDYLMSTYFAAIIPMFFCWLFLGIKKGKVYIPFKEDTGFLSCYACLTLLSTMFFLIASSFDAVRTGVIFIISPIFPIIGDRLILKKKYTWRQNLCIWIITIAAIAFCAVDHFT